MTLLDRITLVVTFLISITNLLILTKLINKKEAAFKPADSGLKVGSKAPAIIGTGFNGESIELAQMKSNKFVYWTSTKCGFCIEQGKDHADKLKAIKEKGYDILVIVIGSNPEEASSFCEDQNLIKFNSMYYLQNKVNYMELYKVRFVPSFTVISFEENIIQTGFAMESDENWMKY